METIEDIILRHSVRGMNLLRPGLPQDMCLRAARLLLSLPRGNVLMATGFFVHTAAETDGPAGTICVANALKALGFTPIIVTDCYAEGIFEQEGLEVIYLPLDADETCARTILSRYSPTALFSLERCGLNANGTYANMRGQCIRSQTAPVDLLFRLSAGAIPSVGVGDGGNEIGMGKVANMIREKLPIVPCIVPTDELIIATVSNWGGYGLCAALSKVSDQRLLPSYEEVRAILVRASRFGCVDGISGLPALTEDGHPEAVTKEILDALNTLVYGERETR